MKKCLGRLPVLVITPILLVAYAFSLGKVLSFAIAWPLWMRYGVAFFIILPLGFIMGMFFPMGIRTLSRRFKGAIPWAWCVNGCTSVIGSVLAVVTALSYGFKTVLCLAAVAYSLALVMLLKSTLTTRHHR
jgi:hypothetical protein